MFGSRDNGLSWLRRRAVRPAADAWLGSILSLLLLAGWASAASGADVAPGQAAGEVDEAIVPLIEVAGGVALGAASEYADVDADRFDLVVDLRYPYEGVYEEMGALRTRGIQVLNIPVSSRGPSLANVQRLDTALSDHAGQRVLIHDSNGHRTAMLWAAYRLWQGSALSAAVEEVRPVYDAPDLAGMLERFRREAGLPEGEQTPGDRNDAASDPE